MEGLGEVANGAGGEIVSFANEPRGAGCAVAPRFMHTVHATPVTGLARYGLVPLPNNLRPYSLNAGSVFG